MSQINAIIKAVFQGNKWKKTWIRELIFNYTHSGILDVQGTIQWLIDLFSIWFYYRQLHLAILGKYVQAIRAIIRLAPVPALLDIRNDDAHAPLHLAVLTRQPEIIRRLLVAGAKVSVSDNVKTCFI